MLLSGLSNILHDWCVNSGYDRTPSIAGTTITTTFQFLRLWRRRERQSSKKLRASRAPARLHANLAIVSRDARRILIFPHYTT